MSSKEENKDYMNTMPKFDFNDSSTRHDRVLLVEGQKFYIQSVLLSTWSDYFDGLFNSDFKEAKSDEEIEIKEVGAGGFENFLKFIYPMEFKISEENYISMIDLAHRFLSPVVLQGCRDFIKSKFKDLDKFALLESALKYNMEEIKLMIGDAIASEDTPSVLICKKGCDHTHVCAAHKEPLTSKGFVLNKNNHLAKNFNHAILLSQEAKAFLFDQILKKNYKKD